MASSARQCLPLKNAGNIDVHLDIKVRICIGDGSLFSWTEMISDPLGSEDCCPPILSEAGEVEGSGGRIRASVVQA